MGSFLEPLIDLLKETIGWFIPFTTVDAEELGMIKRFGTVRPTEGKKHWWQRSGEVKGPGFHWHLPFGIEHMATCHSYTTTQEVVVQAETRAGEPVHAVCFFKYRISNPEPYLTSVGNELDVLQDVGGAACFDEISKCENWNELRAHVNNGMAQAILENTRKEVNQFGFKLYSCKFRVLLKAKPILLLGMKDGIERPNQWSV